MKNLKLLLTAGVLSCAFSSVSVAQETEAAQDVAATVENTTVDSTVNEKVVNPESLTEDLQAENQQAEDQQAEDRLQNDSTETKERSVVVEIHSSSDSRSEDGEAPGVKVRGRVVVIGPDGKRSEYDLNEEQIHGFKVKIGEGSDVTKDLDRIIIMDRKSADKDPAGEEVRSHSAEWVEERFVIGVQCEEADELLRTHLRLGTRGVVVLDVREGTPAAEGGLQKHDIIVSIGGLDVQSREDLTKAVLESEGKPLELSIIRTGEPQVVSVTARKMKVPIVLAPAATDVEQLKELAGSAKGGVRLSLIHPGVMLDGVLPHDHEAINKMIEQLRKTAGEEAARALEQARDEKGQLNPPQRHGQAFDSHQLHQSLKALQDQVRELQQQVTDLQGQLKSKDQPQ